MHLRVATGERRRNPLWATPVLVTPMLVTPMLVTPMLVTLAGVILLAACTSAASHRPATMHSTGQAHPAGPVSTPARAVSPPPVRTARIAGRRMPVSAACPSATPVYLESQGPVVVTTADGITVSGLIQSRSVPPRRGDVKIVWRVTGRGTLRLGSQAPDDRPGRLVFGPEPHGGSSFNAPGDEWGSGFRFSQPGCWHVDVTRGGRTTPVTIAIT